MSFPLLAELQRRRVFRALIGYGIAAFAVLQVIEPIMHGLHWPESVLSYVVVALAAGFPIVVGLAWIFDVNAGRIERTAPAASGLQGARLGLVLGCIGLLAAAPGVIWYFFLRGAAKPAPTAAEAHEAPSIAVLPFADMSPGKDQDYFSDGIAEEILNALAQVEGLRVTGRTSSFSFKGKNEDLRSIGQRLNVAHVLEGSVRKAGSRVRITAQLVNVADGFHLWSQTYDRDLTDIFALQEQIARAVVEALRIRLLPGKSPSTRAYRTEDLEAYRLYLLGKKHHEENNEEMAPKAQEELEKAVALDPRFGPAWATLSVLYYDMESYVKTAAQVADLSRRAWAAAERAVEVAPDLGDAWSSRALRKLDRQDWKGAEEDISHALSLSPRDPAAIRRRAVLHAVLGRYPDALAGLRSALDLDPLNATAWRWRARFNLAEGHLAEARSALERSLASAPSSAESWAVMARLSLMEHRPKDALAAAAHETKPEALATSALAEHELGHVEASRRMLETLAAGHGEIAALIIAEAYAWLGERDAAFGWLDRAYAQQDGDLFTVRTRPMFYGLRGDPRWQAFLRKMNLPVD